MGTFLALLRIVIQRSRANWRLLSAVVLGVVIASALMSSVVIYSDAVRDIGLKFAFRNADQSSLHVEITSTSQKSQADQYDRRKELTLDTLDRQAGDVVEETVLYGRSATFFLATPGDPEPTDDLRPRAHFQFQSGFPDHITVVEGDPMAPTPPTPGQAPAVAVWLGVEAAEQLGVTLGDEFDLFPFWRDDVDPVRVTLAGLIEKTDPAEPYWTGADARFITTTTRWPTYPFWIDETTFVETVAGYLPNMDGAFTTLGLVDTSRIDSRNADSVEGRLTALDSALQRNLDFTSVTTAVPVTISDFQDKLFFTRLPLFALMLMIVGIAIYYVVVVATMVVERQSGEISLLKSRGAGVGQIMAVYAVEGGLVTAVSVIAGPLLAAGAIRLLGPTPPFEELSQGELLEVHLSAQAFLLALLGSLLALAATLWPAFKSAGRSIVHFKASASRPPEQPVFLRYYLDLGLVAVGAFLFYQLRQRGSLVTEELFGDLSADPLLLVSPGLFTLMIALVFLRLFPVALRVASWATRGIRGPTIPLGLWHMVRNPVHYSRLILLLILATGVGMFSAGFGATLTRSYEDRAAYEAGAPLRIGGITIEDGEAPADLQAAVATLPGVEGGTSLAARYDGSYQAARFDSEGLTVLAVDPETFTDAAYWRSDFGAGSLDDILEDTTPSEPFEVGERSVIPAGSRYIGAWINTTLGNRQGRPGIRLADGDGNLITYRMGTAEPAPGEWRFYLADLQQPSTGPAPDLSQPLELDAVYTTVGGAPQSPIPRVFGIDNVTAYSGEVPEDWSTAGLPAEPLLTFDTLGNFEPVVGSSIFEIPGTLSVSDVAAFEGNSARIQFTHQPGTSPYLGIRAPRPSTALPLAVSDSFLEETGTAVGDTIPIRINAQVVQAEIVRRFELFPGFFPSPSEHLALADLDAFALAASSVPGIAPQVVPNEAWVAGFDGALTLEQVREAGVDARDIFSEAEIFALKSSDPLVAASWEGILFLSFATVLVLTALGFVVFSNLAAQTRSLEFAILRTMGFSGRQILGVVTFEQCFVILAGVAAGTALGFPLGRLMIDSLDITERGGDVVPPLISEVSWTTIFTVYGLLALVFAASVASLVFLYSRLALHRTLRIGEL